MLDQLITDNYIYLVEGAIGLGVVVFFVYILYSLGLFNLKK